MTVVVSMGVVVSRVGVVGSAVMIKSSINNSKDMATVFSDRVTHY